MPAPTIGSDPEFLIYDSEGTFIPANSVVPRSTSAEVGTDGHSATGEMRPQYADCPRLHARNVANAIRNLKLMLPSGYIVRAGNGRRQEPTGGHIHIGNIPHSQRITKAMDNYLSPICLMLSDVQAWQDRVLNGSYGKLSDVRQQEHGGFEYRAPPSWLVGQGMAESILCVAYVTAHGAHRQKLPRLDIVNNDAYKRCDKDFYRPHMETIFKGLTKAPLYGRYRHPIAALKSMILLGKTWQEDRDIMERWDFNRCGFRIFPSRDHAVSSMVRDANNRYLTYRGPRILVYGMSMERGGDIAFIGPSHIANQLVSQGLDVRVGAAHGVAESSDHPIRLGISSEIRHRNYRRAVNILNQVVEAAGRIDGNQ